MGLSPRLNSPFYEGAGVSTDVPWYLPVSINGRAYLIDTRKYKRKTVPVLREGSDQSPEVGEVSLNNRGLWRRHQSDWSGGAGQTHLDSENSDRARFLRSKGVDPWERQELSLLPTTAKVLTSVNTNLKLLTVDNYLYLADGNNLKITINPSAPTPTWVTITGGPAAAITSIATDGAYVYVAFSGQLVYRTAVNTASMAAWSVAAQPTLIAYVNGRLLGAQANRLYEIDAAGKIATDAGATANLLDYTHRSATWAWTSVASAPNGVYVGGYVGGVSEIYFLDISESIAGALASPVHAMSLPGGESVYVLDHYGGAMVMGTSAGLRLALIGGSNFLTFGPVIEVTGGVRALHASGQYVWFSWSNYDTLSTGIGRADLARFTSSLVPAYASDLMAGAEGATVQGAVTGIAGTGGRRYFAVTGVGVYGESADKVPSGTLVSGWILWSTYERKVVTSVDVRHDALHGSVGVAVDYDAEAADGGVHVTSGTSGTAGTFGPADPFDAGRNHGERVQIHVVLTRDATVTSRGPVLRRWTVRALAAPVRTDEILLPIVMRTEVATPNGDGAEVHYNVLDEYNYLKSLEASGSIVNYQEGGSSYSAWIEAIEVSPDRWTADMQFFEGLLAVSLLTLSPAS